MTILCTVDDIAGRTACRLVALDEHTVIRCVGDIDVLEVPVRTGVTDTLQWVAAMCMIRHRREVEYGLATLTEEFDILIRLTIGIVDVDTLVINVCSGFHPDTVARLCHINRFLQIVERILLGTVSGSIIAVR